MNFTFDSYVGENFNRCAFHSNNFKFEVINSLETSFQRVGGKFMPDMGCWIFPKNVHSHIIELIIHNTCFVCGGLMVDSTAFINTEVSFDDFGNDAGQRGTTVSRIGPAIQISVRKCSECGHSYTEPRKGITSDDKLKQNRNSLCSCGSGKKFKKCCYE